MLASEAVAIAPIKPLRLNISNLAFQVINTGARLVLILRNNIVDQLRFIPMACFLIPHADFFHHSSRSYVLWHRYRHYPIQFQLFKPESYGRRRRFRGKPFAPMLPRNPVTDLYLLCFIEECQATPSDQFLVLLMNNGPASKAMLFPNREYILQCLSDLIHGMRLACAYEPHHIRVGTNER